MCRIVENEACDRRRKFKNRSKEKRSRWGSGERGEVEKWKGKEIIEERARCTGEKYGGATRVKREETQMYGNGKHEVE